MLKEFEDAHVSNSMRSALLTVITTNYFFTCKQACAILRTFDVGFEQVRRRPCNLHDGGRA